METKNFGLYNDTVLFYTIGGSFASNAWIRSGGKNCGDVLGNKFIAITADDGKEYDLGRDNVSPITEEQLAELFPKAHLAFRIVYRVDQELNCMPVGWALDRQWVHQMINDYTEDEIVEYLINKYKK